MFVSLFTVSRIPEPRVVPPRYPEPLRVKLLLVFVKAIEFPLFPGSRASKKRVFASGRRVTMTDGVPQALMRSRSFVKVEVVSEIATKVLPEVMEPLVSNS